MVHINYKGRLGNKLFQYCNALCDFMETGELILNPLGGLIVGRDCLVKPFPNSSGPPEVTVRDQTGYFQDRKTINKFLKYKSKIFSMPPNRDGLFVHVRLGDIYNNNHPQLCSLSYYQNAIASVSFENGFISSDSPEHPIIEKLKSDFNLQLFTASAEKTIAYGSGFSNKILSLGTFSWWVGFLGNQNNVICPNPHEVEHRNHASGRRIFPCLNWSAMNAAPL